MALAKAMVSIGSHAGRKTAALLTDMSQPLGLAVGNALEVEEACQVLLGKGPEDVRRLSVELAAMMVWLTENAPNLEEARRLAEEKLRDGSAAETFRRVIRAQGGDPNVVDHPEILPRAACVREVFAEKDGWIGCMDTQGVGRSSVLLGAGRETGASVPDPGAGVRFLKKTGDPVKKGEPLHSVCFGRKASGRGGSKTSSGRSGGGNSAGNHAAVFGKGGAKGWKNRRRFFRDIVKLQKL